MGKKKCPAISALEGFGNDIIVMGNGVPTVAAAIYARAQQCSHTSRYIKSFNNSLALNRQLKSGCSIHTSEYMCTYLRGRGRQGCLRLPIKRYL
jgi:hypothetical protein